MIARPMDMVYGPPDPLTRMVPVVRGTDQSRAVWLAPGVGPVDLADWHVNPGPPGGPEHLQWKRRQS